MTVEIVIESMLKVMKNNENRHQSIVDKMVNPLNHIFEDKSFVKSFLSEAKRLLWLKITEIEDKDEHQHFISNGVWELSDGEGDYLDMLYSAVKEIYEVIG